MGTVTPLFGEDPAWSTIPDVWRVTLEAWESYQRSGGIPPSTVALRTYHLSRVGRSLGDPLQVTTAMLLSWLAAQSWAPNTRRSYRSSLRAFYRWTIAAGLLTTSPAEALPPVRVPRGVPRPAPEAAYRVGLAAADPRVRLAVQLAGACGLRRGEIAASCREHVEPDPGDPTGASWSLRVAGKGGHVRMVPLPDQLAAEILAMVPTTSPGWLFPSTHGGHLTPHHLGKLVTAALPDDLTTHTLRHRCGTVAYAATRDLRAVQELLGHAKPETTALYTQVPRDAVRAAVDATSARPDRPDRPHRVA